MTPRRCEDFLQDMVNYAADAIDFVAGMDFAKYLPNSPNRCLQFC
jgi:uncharacterized protein with HEPN domain